MTTEAGRSHSEHLELNDLLESSRGARNLSAVIVLQSQITADAEALSESTTIAAGNGTKTFASWICVAGVAVAMLLSGYFRWRPEEGTQSPVVANLVVINGAGGEIVGMVQIPAGSFQQGLNSEEEKKAFGRPNLDHMKADRLPLRRVTLTPFAIGRHEVTNEEFLSVLKASIERGWVSVEQGKVVNSIGRSKTLLDLSNPFCEISYENELFGARPTRETHPVVAVTWYGASFFCWARNEIEGRPQTINLNAWAVDYSQSGYRLPTEAEWEYSARGGLTKSWFPWGDRIEPHHANYFQSGDPYDDPFGLTESKGTTPVGYFNGQQTPGGTDMANGYGLYDMAGNVQEWCADWYAIDAYGDRAPRPVDFKAHYKVVSAIGSGPAVTNPMGPEKGEARVMRGGSWRLEKVGLGCSIRYADYPERADRGTGFRIVLSQGETE